MLGLGRTGSTRRSQAGARNDARHGRSVGQSLVEFAIVLPVMLGLVGILIDVARLYQAWTNLESATRDAAQYLATSNTDPLSVDYTQPGSDADNKAIFILEQATGASFQRSSTQGVLTDCNQPRLTTTFTENTAMAAGGSSSNPVSTARVMVCLPFEALFDYPFVTIDGSWILRSEREVKLIVGR